MLKYNLVDNSWDKRSLSNVSQARSVKPHHDETNEYAKQIIQNEGDFKKEQQKYLNDEYIKQKRERDLMNSFQRDQKAQEHSQIKAEQSHMASVGIEWLIILGPKYAKTTNSCKSEEPDRRLLISYQHETPNGQR